MIKLILKNTHKALSIISLGLNGGIAGHTILSRFVPDQLTFVTRQIAGLNNQIPQSGIVGDVSNKLIGLNWSELKLSNDTKLLSTEGICKSGIAGLLELRFSDSIFPHTTHFGVVYPALVLFYGDDWHTDSKFAIGLAGVAAFETAYWWLDCGKESHPEV